jgi:hypothetical protein
VISGSKEEGGSCSGKTIIVNGDGTANISISNDEDEDPIIAIHAEVRNILVNCVEVFLQQRFDIINQIIFLNISVQIVNT